MGYLGEDSLATRQSGDQATESTAVPEGVLYGSHLVIPRVGKSRIPCRVGMGSCYFLSCYFLGGLDLNLD